VERQPSCCGFSRTNHNRHVEFTRKRAMRGFGCESNVRHNVACPLRVCLTATVSFASKTKTMAGHGVGILGLPISRNWNMSLHRPSRMKSIHWRRLGIQSMVLGIQTGIWIISRPPHRGPASDRIACENWMVSRGPWVVTEASFFTRA
jgi:hypothetical protein